MSAERWRPVPGYEGIYEASDLGRVRSLDRSNSRGHRIKGRVLADSFTARGYLRANLFKNGDARPMQVHRIILLTFVGPPPEGMEGCHNDGNPANNALSNLRWDTSSGNTRDQVAHGVHNNASRTHCKRGHEFNAENTLTKAGRRRCRVCHRELCRARYVPARQQMEVTSG